MELSRKIAAAITKCAIEYQADVIVFEYLETQGSYPEKKTETSFMEKAGYSEAV